MTRKVNGQIGLHICIELSKCCSDKYVCNECSTCSMYSRFTSTVRHHEIRHIYAYDVTIPVTLSQAKQHATSCVFMGASSSALLFDGLAVAEGLGMRTQPGTHALDLDNLVALQQMQFLILLARINIRHS